MELELLDLDPFVTKQEIIKYEQLNPFFYP